MRRADEPITQWVPIIGRWNIANGKVTYLGPSSTQEPHFPYGICLSEVNVSEADVRFSVIPPIAASNDSRRTSGRLLLGFRSTADEYFLIGAGGHSYAYTLVRFDPASGWAPVVGIGTDNSLDSRRLLKLEVHFHAQQIVLKDDGVRIFEHTLRYPLPEGQLGLFAWGDGPVSFMDVSLCRSSLHGDEEVATQPLISTIADGADEFGGLSPMVLIRKRISELERFDPRLMVEPRPPQLEALSKSIDRTLRKVFGSNTSDYRAFKVAAELQWSPTYSLSRNNKVPLSSYQDGVAEKRRRSLTLLGTVSEQLEEDLLRQARSERISENSQRTRMGSVFIGHGHSEAWRDLKDFITDRLKLRYDEYNAESVAGVPNATRLSDMLNRASFALLVLTAEDEQIGGEMRARVNVIHELGLFQGRLGFQKAIVLLEEGCQEFSNIAGIGHIRFPPGQIRATFEEIRRVLEREGIIQN